jgi:hypothetical protein
MGEFQRLGPQEFAKARGAAALEAACAWFVT